MNRVNFAVVYTFGHAMVLPLALQEWGPMLTAVFAIEAALGALLIAAYMRVKVALWILLVLLVAQLACIESPWLTFFVNAGYGFRIGLVGGPELGDSGIGWNFYNGYYASGAIRRLPRVLCITNGRDTLAALMVNVSVVPPLVAIWPEVMRRKRRKGEPGATDNPGEAQ
jgi:hypothetical protein